MRILPKLSGIKYSPVCKFSHLTVSSSRKPKGGILLAFVLLESQLTGLQQGLNGGNPEVVKPLLQDCQGWCDRHLKRVLEAQKQWEKAKNEATQAEGELQALISGLKAYLWFFLGVFGNYFQISPSLYI